MLRALVSMVRFNRHLDTLSRLSTVLRQRVFFFFFKTVLRQISHWNTIVRQNISLSPHYSWKPNNVKISLSDPISSTLQSYNVHNIKAANIFHNKNNNNNRLDQLIKKNRLDLDLGSKTWTNVMTMNRVRSNIIVRLHYYNISSWYTYMLF